MGTFGSDEITNYNSAKDVIQLDGSDFANLAAIHADAFQIGANTVIHDGSHGTITLDGVQLSTLHFDASHFVLA
jgi:Ca2+-binding RTX toxin-like protein